MSKIQAWLVVGTLVVFGGMAACTMDSEEQLIPQPVDTTGSGIDTVTVDPGTNGCDTATVSYQNTVVSILSGGGCVGCHSGNFPSGNVSLGTYADVVRFGERAYGSMAHLPGFSPMPKGRSMLDNCEIRQFRAWLDQGAQDN